MANRNRLQNAISIILTAALILGMGTALAGAGHTPPENPISDRAETLHPESMAASGALRGTDGESREDEGREATNTPEPSEPPETPPPTPAPETTPTPTPRPESTPEPTHTPEPTADPDEGGEEQQPSPSPDSSQPPEDGGGENAGGTEPGDNQGGNSDSGENGGGDSGGDGDGGAEGGQGGEGGDEDNTPRIYTDLYNNMYITRSELPDGILQFQAYPIGEGNLSVSVKLQNENTPVNGVTLSSYDARHYSAELVFNADNYITIYLKEDGKNREYVRYKISYYADKADEEHPEVGDCPPTIVTSLDGESLDIHTEHIVFWVRATRHPDLGGGTIFSNQIQVWLDGQLLDKGSGDARPEYDIYFPVPNVDDYATHVIKVLAWDGYGNSTYKYYTINYHRVPQGVVNGNVTVVLDITAAGIGIMDMGQVMILGGDTVASAVVRFLEDYGYTPTYDGTTENAFYLRKISRADLGRYARIPPLLREYLERDGVTFTVQPRRDELGEFDFTRGAGWMYSVNGTVYAGRGMSEYPAEDGMTIYLRFTMAWGKDIGGFDATGEGYGTLSSYCRVWINGTVQELTHDFREVERVEPTETEDGYVDYMCSKCHDEKREILPATGEDPGTPDDPTPSPGPTDEPTPSPEPSESPTPSPEPTEQPTPTPEPSPTPTPPPTPTPTPPPTPTPTPPPTPPPDPTAPPEPPEPPDEEGG